MNKNINFCVGLPRSGSTILMHILNEHTDIYCTGTCPLSNLLVNIRQGLATHNGFLSMDMDVLDTSVLNFLKYGIQGWFKNQTNKTNIISKNRTWDEHYRFVFKIYDNPKFLFCVRDLRDIILSYEKLLYKYPHVYVGTSEKPFEWNNFSTRIKYYLEEKDSNLGRCLQLLHHNLEHIEKHRNNFFIFRYEDFSTSPKNIINQIYDWLEVDKFEHNFKDIKKLDYYEHDTVYASLVSHKVRNNFEPVFNDYTKYFTREQNDYIISQNLDYYNYFYPEVLHGNR